MNAFVMKTTDYFVSYSSLVSGAFGSVRVSPDGNFLITFKNNGKAFTGTSGDGFILTEQATAIAFCRRSSLTYDGKYIVAVASAGIDSYLYYSDDYGVTFTTKLTNSTWQQVAISTKRIP